MNSSLQVTTTPVECVMYDFVGGVPQHFSTQAYTVLVINIIILVVTCPFTVGLNLLTIVAVKMKTRLQSMSNIALACLATTDLLVGVISQPITIFVTISALQSQATSDVCQGQNIARYLGNLLVFSSLLHLAIMSADRYLAIKRSYSYEQTVTTTRVLSASAIAWMFCAAVHFFHFIDGDLFLTIQSSLALVLMVSIAIFSVVLYREARRHEKLVAAQQVSVEAREKFLKERRALRLTITVVVTLFLTYLPIIIFRIIVLALKDKVSLGALYAFYFSGGSVASLNSLINPLIYSVRLRQFRVAFIEIILKKNHAEAEEFETRLFGTENTVVNFVPNQGGERKEKIVNEVSTSITTVTSQGEEKEENNANRLNEITMKTMEGENCSELQM